MKQPALCFIQWEEGIVACWSWWRPHSSQNPSHVCVLYYYSWISAWTLRRTYLHIICSYSLERTPMFKFSKETSEIYHSVWYVLNHLLIIKCFNVKRCPWRISHIQCLFLTNLLLVTGRLTCMHTQKSKMGCTSIDMQKQIVHVMRHVRKRIAWDLDTHVWQSSMNIILICQGNQETCHRFINEMLNSRILFFIEIFTESMFALNSTKWVNLLITRHCVEFCTNS